MLFFKWCALLVKQGEEEMLSVRNVLQVDFKISNARHHARAVQQAGPILTIQVLSPAYHVLLASFPLRQHPFIAPIVPQDFFRISRGSPCAKS